MAPNNPSMSQLLRIVESAGEVIFEAKERLLYPPIVYDGDGNKKPYELYYDAMANKEVGDTVTSHAAAPGMGKTVRRITRMDDTGVYGVKIEDTVQIMEPWMVEDNYEPNFEPKANICPDCLGTGDDELTGPGYECERCDGEGSVFEDENDARGKMCPVCSGGRREGYGSDCPNCNGEGYVTEDDHGCAQCGRPADGNEELCSECAGGFYEDKEEFLDRLSGTHKEGFELEYDSVYGVYKLIVGDQVILLGTDDYEEAQREAEAMMQDPNFYESSKPYAGTGKEPYATMTDGPDKYLFRKDGKQKLVGSADNEPEDGEEELEETDMDKEIREMQIAAGIIVAEEEVVDEGKLPDALKKHQFGKKDDDKEEEVDKEVVDKEEVDEDCPTDPGKNADGECSPLTHASKNVDVVREDDFEEAIDEDWGSFTIDPAFAVEVFPWEEGEEQRNFGSNYSVAKKFAQKYGGVVIRPRPEEYEVVREDRFEEDLLLAPEDPKGPEVDEDDMVYGEPGKGKSYGSKDFHKFGDEDYDDDSMARGSFASDPRFDRPVEEQGPDSASNDNWGVGDYVVTVWEEPGEYNEPLEVIGVKGDSVRVRDDYGNTQLMSPNDLRLAPKSLGYNPELPGTSGFKGMTEEGPGEFDYDPDAMVDVGDPEDYERYDFENEFETMLGGSSDPVGVGAGSMYEMNEIRRLAGMEPIEEEKAKQALLKEHLENFSGSTYDLTVSGEEYGDSSIIDYARGMVWNEIKTTHNDIKYARYIDTVNDVDIYYDEGADYYFFAPTDEINEIRKLAGMEPIEEKKSDKDYDGDGKIESEEDEWKGSKDKAIKKAMAEDKADKDYDGDGEIESSKDEWKGSRDKAIKKELDEAEAVSPLKVFRRILQNAGIKTVRAYNDKNVGNRKLRIYTGGGLKNQSVEELEKIVTNGMEDAGYQVRKVLVTFGRRDPGVRDFSQPQSGKFGFEATTYPNVVVWLEGNPVSGRYQTELSEERGDVVAYEIADEKAYYIMADLLGAELDFGPEDEILVPAERNDQIIAALTDQGFIEGEDYRVAGQMLDDLQNGYNDRAFTKGQDYFPKGAQSTPASDLGPSASGMADNPMSNKMRMVKKDEVYETMKLAYRRHRKA